jgi:hypothetical protein
MNFLLLLVIALIASASVIWLVNYAPIIRERNVTKRNIFGRVVAIKKVYWSPRLKVCKLLIPLDIIATSTLIGIPLFGGIHGIQSFVCGVFIGAGLTLGVIFIRKVMIPKWETQFKEKQNEISIK